MSLDGFVTGPNDSIERPLGEGASGTNQKILEEAFNSSGAVIMGRRMFDVSETYWAENPPFNMSVFVVTHHKHQTEKRNKTK